MDKQEVNNLFEQKLDYYKGEFSVKHFLGKVDCFGTGRRSNEAVMSMTIRKKEEGLVFTASAEVWNHIHTDVYMGGQCVDEVLKLLEEAKASKPILREARFICDMWEKYHLNDMHAGTPAQEALLKAAVANGELENYGASNYNKVCSYLDEHGMLIDKDYGTKERFPDGYKYGCGWLFEAIPEKDLDFIKEFMVTGEVPKEYQSERVDSLEEESSIEYDTEEMER